MIEGLSVLNYSVYVSGIVLCCLGILMLSIFGKAVERRSRICFTVFFLTLAVDLAVNIAGEALYGGSAEHLRKTIYFLHLIHQLLSPILAYIVCFYQIGYLDDKRKRYYTILSVMFAFFLVMLIWNGAVRAYFDVTESGQIRRSSRFVLSFAISFLPILLSCYMLIFERKALTKGERLAFWLYNLIPAAAVIAQLFVRNSHFIIPATIIAALVMFVFIIREQTISYYEQRQQQTEMSVSLMLSQIQPHFLYNALDSIYYLCENDPELAKKAVAEFSQYLRVNLGSVKQKEPIPFEKELQHTETYLKLEKMSMEDKLDYEFRCEVKDFMIPVLTLQPLVENAVKHGISERAEGGRVTIGTKRDGADVVITVEDNGVGFDVSAPDDGQTHIGIENVRRRLMMQCGGTLSITGTPGEGTRAEIRIGESHEDISSRR